MTARSLLPLISLVSLISIHGADEIQKPTLSKDGLIVCGAKSLRQALLKPPYTALKLNFNVDDVCTGGETIDCGAGGMNPLKFLNQKESFDGSSTVFTAGVRDSIPSDKQLGTYRMSLTLLENGLAKVETLCVLEQPGLLKDHHYLFRVPEYMEMSGVYTKDGKVVPFDAKTLVSFSGDELKDLKFVFFPEKEETKFSIQPDQCSKVVLGGKGLTLYPAKNGPLSFLVDISGRKSDSPASETAPNGVNVWDADKLHWPDFAAGGGNLVLNPSFEADLRYWTYRTFVGAAIPLKYQGIYELDNKEAHSGSSSLRIRALTLNNPLPLGTNVLPVESGEKYTLSFWAKGSVDQGLTLQLEGRGTGRGRTSLAFEGSTTFAVGKEWKRYSIPLVAQDPFCAVYFLAKLAGVPGENEAFVWVDDVQVEKGGMTNLAQPPISVQLLSTARGNFLEFGQAPDFRLAIKSKPETQGSVSLSVEDFFFREIFKGDYKFTTDKDGRATIPLEELSKKITKEELRGVFSVSARFKTDGTERPFTDFFRFSVMNFLENKHKNKNLFNIMAAYTLQPGGPDMERFLAHERAVGIGSVSYDFLSFANDLDYALDEERVKLLEKYGMEQLGRTVVSIHSGKGGVISERNGALKMENITQRINPTDEDLATFESICAEKARSRPWNKIWFFSAESNPGYMPLVADRESFAKFLLATNRGIKKGNPDAKVLIEGGPWTIAPATGIKWVEEYIQDTKKLDPLAKFDGAAGHFYCNSPESYDLDANVGEMLKMLDRNGHPDWPLYLNEGSNFAPMNIPSEGISPYIVHSINSWYIGPLSYHMGRAERTSAALSARAWLVALKYQDRVKSLNDFGTPSRYMDIDFTPRAFDKIPNTLGRILGDASFSQDIRFAPFCRAYLFKDDKTGAPIAAIWGHKESVDRWKEGPPLIKFNFGEQKLRFIDLMENPVEFPRDAAGRTTIPMSPFPLFIKGEPGTEKELVAAIANPVVGVVESGDVQVSAFPNFDGKASWVFKNQVSRALNFKAQVTLNGEESKLALSLPPLGSKEEQVVSSQTPGFGTLQMFEAQYAIEEGKPSQIAGGYLLLNEEKSAIKVDGDLSDWKDVPMTDLGEGVSLGVVFEGKRIILAIRANQESRPAEEALPGVGLYLDPLLKTDAWTEPRTVAGIAGELGVYEILKGKEGGMVAWCRFSQGLLAGMDKELMIAGQIQKLITVKTGSADGAACLEIEMPEKIFAPLTLVPGSRFGLNVSVPGKSGGSRTLAPIAGFKNPSEPGEISMVMVILGRTEEPKKPTEK